MCGIAGAITNKPIDEYFINNTISSLNHRGPDASGKSIFKNITGDFITLVHTRLSILDLEERSNQPMRYKNIELIFNGEIYNYLELRQKLSNEFNFKTDSDTEVLLMLLYKKGIDGLKDCEGMFSLAFFDHAKETLYLARDKFGEKPFYYYRDKNGELFFGSEPKSIFALSGVKPLININHIRRFLVNGYKSLYKKKETFFKNIEEIPPGGCVELSPHFGLKNYQWNKFSEYSPNNEMTYQEAVDGTRERLVNAMKIRLRSDVPIAFCLSGGIDSNALIGIAKNLLNYDVHGFTIMNKDSRYEEKDMVEYAVKEQDLKHTPIPVEKENFLENLSSLVKAHDSPISTISYYAHSLLMKAISKNGYKVSMSGTGADEIFSGYYDHHLAYLSEIYFIDKDLYNCSLANWISNIKPIVRNPYLKDHQYFIKNPLSRKHIYLDCDLYNEYLTYPFLEEFEEKFYSNFLLRNRMANELFHESVPVILHEDDLNSMLYSVENRSPFLDSKLYEWSLKIPTKFLIKNSLAKSILRDASKDFAPDKIMQNPRKVGFNVPIDDYLDFEDKKVLDELSKDSAINEIVNFDNIKNLFKSKKRSNEESKFLFNYLSVRYFMECFS